MTAADVVSVIEAASREWRCRSPRLGWQRTVLDPRLTLSRYALGLGLPRGAKFSGQPRGIGKLFPYNASGSRFVGLDGDRPVFYRP